MQEWAGDFKGIHCKVLRYPIESQAEASRTVMNIFESIHKNGFPYGLDYVDNRRTRSEEECVNSACGLQGVGGGI